LQTLTKAFYEKGKANARHELSTKWNEERIWVLKLRRVSIF